MNNRKVVVFYGDSVLENSNYVEQTTEYCLRQISNYEVINRAIDGNMIVSTFETLCNHENALSNDLNADVAVISLGGNDFLFNFLYYIKINDWNRIYENFINNFVYSTDKPSIIEMYKTIIKKLCSEYRQVIVLGIYNAYMFWDYINDLQKELCKVFVHYFNKSILIYCKYLKENEKFNISYVNLEVNSDKYFIYQIEPSEHGSFFIASEIYRAINV